ncbi:glutathione S-transferase family protein [Gymnodinialimonas sp. 2305UL16-5]|uniref:glutathione S-transferase family protein n=1 Tax=Gymnodinialimonas mytili TaxID=3126503 RepID=UPI00309F5EEC
MHTLFACLGSGNCFKPWLALHQTGQSVNVELIDVLKGEQKSDRYLQINPAGVVPFLQTDAGADIGESNAMLWFIAEGTHLMPDTAEERAEALQWMFYEQSKLEPFISPARFFTTILPGERAARAEDIADWHVRAAVGLHHLDTHLESRPFMLKSGYSIADIAVFGYVHVLEEAGLSLLDYPSIARWIDAVRATDGFRPLSELGQAELRAA